MMKSIARLMALMHMVMMILFFWNIGAAEVERLDMRIRDLMKQMTLEEKIGQMTQIDMEVASPEIINKYFIGSVLVGGGTDVSPTASADTWIRMANNLQYGALSTRLGIPVIIGTDAVHGHNNAYNATIFPHNVGLGVTRDPELVKKIGAATALELRATGIPYTFAPCLAVCRDPRWVRCFESYSEDPKIAQAMTEIIPGLQGDVPSDYQRNFPFMNGRTPLGLCMGPAVGAHKSNGASIIETLCKNFHYVTRVWRNVAACAKHFVGDGGTTNGIDENNTVVDWDGLSKIHMQPFVDSIEKGVASVMISYSSWNGVKMHSNYDLITGYLKNKLNFQGFVISDSEGIDKITSPPHANYTYSILTGILAGIDMVMVPKKFVEFIHILTQLVKKNFIPMSRIDDAVERILRVKFILGLFESPITDLTLVNQLGSQEHRELAREAVRKSLVLLKNGKSSDLVPLLPLPKKASKILVAGTHANNIGYQCGGWTIEWPGLSGNITSGTTILHAIKNTVDPLTEVVYSENPGKEFLELNDFSYAVVAVGELPYSETTDNSKNLTLAEPFYDIINNVCESTKCVVILISGRPIVIEPYLEKMDALVAAWFPGTEGQGVADVLFGDYGFTGKLARTWFRTVDQLPMNVGDSYYDPLFPFGYGLTTTPIGLSLGSSLEATFK